MFQGNYQKIYLFTDLFYKLIIYHNLFLDIADCFKYIRHSNKYNKKGHVSFMLEE